jgi:hypothetical protein
LLKNMVMIVELKVPASLVGIMIALPLIFAPFRAIIGFRSDHHRSALGWRRVPYLWMGTMVQFGGLAMMPFALLVLAQQGHAAEDIDAVLAVDADRLDRIESRLEALPRFRALPEAGALAAANKRIGNILKKAGEVDAHVNTALLCEDAEKRLHAAMQQLLPPSEAQFKSGDYTASLQTLAALRAPVDAFFEGVMVNADEMDLRLNRQGLLKMLHVAMNRVADLSRLAV